MDIEFNCPVCGQRMVIDKAGAGLVIQCPKCKRNVRVPSPFAPDPSSGAKPATAPRPPREHTVVLNWTPPSGSTPKEPKK